MVVILLIALIYIAITHERPSHEQTESQFVSHLCFTICVYSETNYVYNIFHNDCVIKTIILMDLFSIISVLKHCSSCSIS